jgi:hypothetical protein
MKKFTKWIALLMAGLLLSATLIACDDGYDWSEEEDGDDDEEQSESSSQYKNLTPEELWDAILEAKDFTVVMEGSSQKGEIKAKVTYTIAKDGDKLQLTMERTNGDNSNKQTAYYDLKNNLAYEEVDGQWYYEEGDEEDSDLSDLLDDLIPVDLLFDKKCYKTEDYENGDYVMRANAIAEELGAPEDITCQGEMTSKSSTYTFTISAANDEQSLEYVITVKFKSDSIQLPDAKPVENEGEALPDVDER